MTYGAVPSGLLSDPIVRYDVIFTVRSTAKGERIIKVHGTLSKDRLSYVIVEDIGKTGAYDQVSS